MIVGKKRLKRRKRSSDTVEGNDSMTIGKYREMNTDELLSEQRCRASRSIMNGKDFEMRRRSIYDRRKRSGTLGGGRPKGFRTRVWRKDMSSTWVKNWRIHQISQIQRRYDRSIRSYDLFVSRVYNVGNVAKGRVCHPLVVMFQSVILENEREILGSTVLRYCKNSQCGKHSEIVFSKKFDEPLFGHNSDLFQLFKQMECMGMYMTDSELGDKEEYQDIGGMEEYLSVRKIGRYNYGGYGSDDADEDLDDGREVAERLDNKKLNEERGDECHIVGLQNRVLPVTPERISGNFAIVKDISEYEQEWVENSEHPWNEEYSKEDYDPFL